MKESDIKITPFSINNEKFEFLQKPFGLTNAPILFQRTMDNILRKQVGKRCMFTLVILLFFQNKKLNNMLI